MPSLKDIGNGIKMLDLSGEQKDMLDEATKSLKLVELANTIRQAPLDEATKRANLTKINQEIQDAPAKHVLDLQKAELNHADIQNIELDRAIKNANLQTTLGTEKRAKIDAIVKGVESVRSLLNTNPEIAVKIAPLLVPGLNIVQNKDKTFAGIMPDGKGGVQNFPMDSTGIASPEKRAEYQKFYMEHFEKAPVVTEYVAQQTSFNNLQQLAAIKKGPSDMSMLFALSRIHNPNAVVREGSIETLKNVQGLPDELQAAINRAITHEAPIFANDSIRQQFVRVAAIHVANGRKDAVQAGQNAFGFADGFGLNPLGVVSRQGDIDVKEFVPPALASKYPQLTGTDTAPPPPLGGKPPAGSRTGAATSTPATQSEVERQTEQQLNDTLGNIFR